MEVRESARVDDIRTSPGGVEGVVVDGEYIPADAVVCTVHSWTNLLLARVERVLPIKSFVHQRYVSSPLDSPLQIPAVNANAYYGYVRPAEGNRILAGGETMERDEEPVPSPDFRMESLAVLANVKQQLTDGLTPLVPRLAETT